MKANANIFLSFFIHTHFHIHLHSILSGSSHKGSRTKPEIKDNNSFTSRGIPWKLASNIICQSSSQAYKIEKHIKAMHSKKYIQNLCAYPEMVDI